MRKKFTMLLAALFLTLGTAWAQSEFVKVGKPYTLNCKSSSHKGFLKDDGTGFLGQSDTPTLFIFEAAGDGKVYIKSEKTNKYLNAKDTPADGGAISYDDQPSTAWTIGSLNGDLHFSAAENLYLNNVAGTNSLQIKSHNPIGTNNACSLWNVEEAIELTTSEDDIKWYTIKNVKSGKYATYSKDNANMQLQPYYGEAGKFYFTGTKDEDGKLFTVKIHNAATQNLCNGVASWTAEGCDWYIQLQNINNPGGYAISSTNDLTNDDYSWNNYQGAGKQIATYNGNDGGSSWEFASIDRDADLRTLPEMSTTEAPVLYYIRNVRHFGKYANYVAEGSRLTQVATPGLGSYWYFVAAGDAPEGWVACKIYNAANATSLQNPDGTFGDQVYYIKKHEWEGRVGFAIKRSTNDTNTTRDGWNDAGANGTTIGDYYADDLGSIWWIELAPKTADQLKSEAATALTNAQAAVALYGEADYFTYPADAVAAAKAAIEGLDVTSNLAAAVSGHMAVNTTLATLQSEQKNGAPAVGDYIRMKNRSHNKYIYAADDGKVRGLDGKADTKTLWLVGGTEGAFKLKNFVSQTFISAIEQDVDATMVEEASAGEFTFSNVEEAYASVKTKDGGTHDCANFNTWYSGRVLGWTDNGDEASHWVFSQAYPLTVVYKYNDEELTESGVSTFVDKGETYIVPEVTNTQAEFLAIESCTINEEPLEAENGVWSVTVTQNTTIEVTLKSVATVTDLSTLDDNLGIYILEAERSPLMYSATEGMTTKLSSGLVDGVSANANDINQQFIIFTSKTDGAYYLYSLGANKFVDADLNFTDYPEPVLSFAANANNADYPWYVKINDKFVVPGNGGEDGNKIHHTSDPEEDDGKRYRIIKVGEDADLAISVASIIEHADGLIKDASDLSNSKVYTVSTYDRGVWSYNAEKDALWYAESVDTETNTEHFAFLTVGGRTYLYSVGAGKFVVKSGDYTAYSEVPSQPVEILKATGNKFFPLVVALIDGEDRHHIGISPTFEPPVITFYEDLGDPGNKVDIREVGELENSAEILATMDAYLAAQTLVPELEALIARAGEALTYLLEADKEALATAKTDAENVLAGNYDSEMLGNQITALTTALNNATLVSETTGFNNAYVYTFVSQRGWMVATDANTVKSADEGAADNALHQWAVYKSANNNYYLYNIGKQEFMGFANVQNEEIPFAATPQMTTLIFKKSNWEDYPIMFSVDNVGVVNNNDRGAMIYWNNGWNNLQDGGNNHKVTIVGAVPSETLTAIENAVVLFEAVDALQKALADADKRLDNALGYYSCTAETQAELDAIEEFLAIATDAAEVNAKTARVNELIATFTLNVPQAGKFYRLKGKASEKYMSTPLSTDAASRVKMRLSENPDDAGCIFYLTANNKLLSYKLGTFLQNTYDINALGESNGNTVNFNKSESNNLGFFTLKTDFSGSQYIYDDVNDTEVDRNSGYAANNCEWTVEEVTTLPVTVTAAGWGTFYTPVAVTVPNTVTAYTITAVGEKATLTEVTGTVPAGTGLILEGEGTHDFTIATEDAAEDFVKGLLQGSTAKTYVTAEPNTTYYVLAKPAGAADAGLYKAKLDKNEGAAFLNGANKVYLPVTVAEQGAPAMFAFTRGDEEGDSTGIESVELGGELVIYDLAGRRVAKMEKGIYIVNGKKVVIK